jgi:hypothetical protein
MFFGLRCNFECFRQNSIPFAFWADITYYMPKKGLNALKIDFDQNLPFCVQNAFWSKVQF